MKTIFLCLLLVGSIVGTLIFGTAMFNHIGYALPFVVCVIAMGESNKALREPEETRNG